MSENEEHFTPNSQNQREGSNQQKQLINNDPSKKYAIIDQSIRVMLLKRILSKEATIKEAAKEFGVNFSTAKAILQTYRKEGRIGKKKTRDRNKKGKGDDDDDNSYKGRKVQSMIDLDREIHPQRRTFSPDLKPCDKQFIQNQTQAQQQFSFLSSSSQIPSAANLDEQNAKIALALCQNELAKQKIVNMQLMMMIQNFQSQGQSTQNPLNNNQLPIVKEEYENIN